MKITKETFMMGAIALLACSNFYLHKEVRDSSRFERGVVERMRHSNERQPSRRGSGWSGMQEGKMGRKGAKEEPKKSRPNQ